MVQASTYVLLLAIGYRWNAAAPIFFSHPPGTPAVDPMVQALVLTDIVIGATVTDAVLAGAMNGRDIADHARAKRPRMPILFTSGYARDAIVHHQRLDSGVDLLPKPFSYAALAAKVRQCLSQSEGSAA